MSIETIILPSHEVIRYSLNAKSEYYSMLQAPAGFTRMPLSIRVEPTQKTDRIKTKLLVRGRHVTWDEQILTGLVLVADRWFYGDHLYRSQKNLILFRFSPDNQELTVYYFANQYPLDVNQRMRLIQLFIQNME